MRLVRFLLGLGGGHRDIHRLGGADFRGSKQVKPVVKVVVTLGEQLQTQLEHGCFCLSLAG